MPTNVPGLVIGPNGIIVPPDSALLAGTLADIISAFGGGLNPALTTPQGQLATTLAAIIGDKNTQLLQLFNSFDPAFSSGRMQDGLGRIYFIDRFPATSTIVIAQCIGQVNKTIPAGTFAVDTSRNLYVSLTAATFPPSGTMDVTFASVNTGPITCPAGALNLPYKTISGWDRVINAAPGVLGRVVETSAEFELRRSQSVAINASGSMPSIRAAVIATDSVTDCFAFDNDSGVPVPTGTVTLAASTIYVAVVGGNDNDVAKAIWRKKGPGAGYTGNTSVMVYDDSSYYAQPYPTYTVKFTRPTLIPIFFTITIAKNDGVPNDAAMQISNKVVAAFAGADGGTRATIGSLLLASRYYAGILNLGNWSEIITVKIGLSASDYNDSLQINIDQMPVVSMSNINVLIGLTTQANATINLGAGVVG